MSERRITVEPIDIVIGIVLVTSVVMLVMLAARMFYPSAATFLSGIISLCVGLLFVRRVDPTGSLRSIAPAGVLVLVALLFRWDPFLYTLGGQDQGIYVVMSSHYGSAHEPGIIDAVRQKLPEGDRAEYDRFNNEKDIIAPGRAEGQHQLGIFVSDLGRSSYIFQFYPLHPLWMALAARWLGSEERVYSLVVLSLLATLMLALLACELSGGNRLAGLLAAVLIAFAPMHVFLSRFPVSENVMTLFSATALYYLVRYFKSRSAGVSETWRLALSAMAWGCLFFTHIAGFLYAPFIALASIVGVATARTTKELREFTGYGLAVIALYAMSLWYGMAWSFPYSYYTYTSILPNWGAKFVEHWKLACVLAAAAYISIVWAVWRLRPRLTAIWSKPRLGNRIFWLLLVVILATAATSVLEAYRLGYTDKYLNHYLFDKAWALSHSGLRGLLHSSGLVLMMYVSPFTALFVLVMMARGHLSGNLYVSMLVAFIAMFVVLRIGLEPLTYFYFYGRYLTAELVPYVLVLAAVWLASLFSRGGAQRVVAGTIVGLTLAWQVPILIGGYTSGEAYRYHRSIQPLVGRATKDDVILFAGVQYPQVRTTLDYYYGLHTVEIDPTKIREAIRLYAKTWADVYVLSATEAATQDTTYVGAVTVMEDHYGHGGLWDTLPINARSAQRRLYLHVANRASLTQLQEGDVIDFKEGGNSEAYLGTGWSAQEKMMRWTDGPSASLKFTFPNSSESATLNFKVRAFNCTPVTVRVNEEVRASWTFSDCVAYTERVISLTKRDFDLGTRSSAGRAVTITFDMPEARSPRDVNPAIYGDARMLGLSVAQIIVGRARMTTPTTDPGKI